MKNKSILFIALLILFSCKENTSEIATITIINNNSIKDTIGIYDFEYDIIKSIPIGEKERITDTLNIKEGYYLLKEKENYHVTYLNSSIKINLHLENDSIKFSGIGGNENNYLIKKEKFINSLISTAPSSSSYTSLSEDRYLNLVNSNYNKKVNFLNKFENLNERFLELETESFYYDKMVRLVFYESNLQYIKNDNSFKVSENFPQLYNNLNLTNEKLLIHYNYLFYVNSYLKIKTAEKLKKNPDLDEVITKLETADEEIDNIKIKERIIFWNYKWSFVNSKNIDKAYQKFNLIVKNESYKKIIKDKYFKTKKIGKGDIAPTFKFVDKDDSSVSLSDFKGNIVYIDIWNTYCKPCIVEIPKFEKLKNRFSKKKIKFVSICVNSPKENWKKMIEKKNLTGIQLFSKESNGEFFEKFMFNSAPRYILIDKEGKIVESHAGKPSDQKLIEEIERLLK
jgi:peroxiredoxin